MLPDISPEAAVAGEAAAAAVDELQTREAVAETAMAAVTTSEVAADLSTTAVEAAENARITAEVAEDQAAAASALAADTAAAVGETIDYARVAHDNSNIARNEVAELKEMIQEFMRRVSEPQEETPTVQEVPVNDTETEPTGESGRTTPGESGESASGRRRIRRLSRRTVG